MCKIVQLVLVFILCGITFSQSSIDFNLCSGQNRKAEPFAIILDSIGVVFLESLKENIDIESLDNLFQIANGGLCDGKNQRGNRIELELSNIEELDYELLYVSCFSKLKKWKLCDCV